MNDEDRTASADQRGREAFLGVVLATFVGGGAVVFLIFVSGGFFFWVLLIGAGIGLFSGLHYLLWGRSFTEEIEREREEQELEEEADWDSPQRKPWERRF